MTPAELRPEVYPWNEKTVWRRLQVMVEQQHLPHALLFTGLEGLGKTALAVAFAQGQLCEKPNKQGLGCGECKTCRLNHARTHPDLKVVSLAEGKKVIGVDSIREVVSFYSQRPHFGQHKVVIIMSADTMNREASNSLLKVLEEPPNGALLVLVSAHPERLLPTIRSRCQTVVFPPVDEETTAEWLTAQAGDTLKSDEYAFLPDQCAPLAALAMIENGTMTTRKDAMNDIVGLLAGSNNPLTLAEKWSKSEGGVFLDVFNQMIERLVVNCQAKCSVKGGEALALMEQKATLGQWFGFRDQLLDTLRLGQGSLNQQMLFEDILIRLNRL